MNPCKGWCVTAIVQVVYCALPILTHSRIAAIQSAAIGEPS
jgi:hypothetical protein